MNTITGSKELNAMSREQLYEAVWGESMLVLARKFEISDVGLKKRCKALGVPTPGVGYWAKVQAGHNVKKTPLPDTWIVERKKKTRLPKSPEGLRRFRPPERSYELEKPGPRVAATKRVLDRKKPDASDGLIEAWGEGVLRTGVAAANVDRALWLWSRLLEETTALGLKLVPGRETRFTDGIQTLGFDLRERVGKYLPDVHPPEGGAARLRYDKDAPPSPQFAPKGFLRFRAEDVYEPPCPLKWTDTQATPLDDRIPELASHIDLLLKRKAQRELEIQEAAERRRIEEIRAYEERERRRIEEGRRRKLARLATQHRRAEEIRSLVEQLSSKLGEVSARAGVGDWLGWARKVADDLDPIQGIAGSLGSGEDPVTPDYEDLYPNNHRWSF